MKVVYWGTYDLNKPRNRIMIKGLEAAGCEVIQCRADVWRGVEDKSRVQGIGLRLVFFLKWVSVYPALLLRYARLPRHDVVVIGYLGHLDVFMIWLLARLRGVPLCWDAFLSLYNTVVEDRRLLPQRHPLSWCLYAWEWWACRLVDRIILDTKAHARYFVETFGLDPGKAATVMVGAETDIFFPKDTSPIPRKRRGLVLFYGQFSPMHGIVTVIRAAALLGKKMDVEWVLIGQGQLDSEITRELSRCVNICVRRLPWVEYRELNDWLNAADVCIGVVGDSGKAGRVVPNKVYQGLAAGCPVVTRDSEAIRELPDLEGLFFVPPADAKALAAAVRKICLAGKAGCREKNAAAWRRVISPHAVGMRFIQILNDVLRSNDT